VLAGRDGHVQQVSSLLARVKETGQGVVIAFFGEAGIGKTALLDHTIDHARKSGFHVGVGRAKERDQIVPMAAMLEAVVSGPTPLLSGGNFADLAPLYGHPVWLVDRLTSLLEERLMRSPLAIAIDDVQWADQLSLFALRIIPQRLAGLPIAWILTSRSQPSDAAQDLIAAISPNVPVVPLELQPLQEQEVEQLALDRLGVVPNVRLRTLLTGARGNPFLAVELLDAFAHHGAQHIDQLPHSFIDRVSQQLWTLPPDSLRMVQVASVLGGTFLIDDAAALMSESAETLTLSSLEPAIRSGILDDNGDALSFRHELLRQAVYEGIPPTVRKALHRRAAGRILATGRGVLEAAPHVLAYAATADGESETILREAAALLVTSMPDVAANLIQRSFALLPSKHPARFDTGKEAIELLSGVRRGNDALVIVESLLASQPSNEEIAQIEALAGVPLWDSGRLDELLARVEAALTLDGVSPPTKVRLDALRCLALSRSADLEAVIRDGQSALEKAQRFEDRQSQTIALQALGETSRNAGLHGDALGYFHQLRSLAGEGRVTDEVLTLQLLDRYDESATLLDEIRRSIAEKGATTSVVLSVVFGQLWHNYSLGLLDEAGADGATLLRLSEEFEDDTYRLEARLILARMAQLRGDIEAARAHFANAALRIDRGDAGKTLMLLLVDSWLKENEGDLQCAADAVEQVIRPSRTVRHRWRLQGSWLIAATRIAVQSGRTSLAQDIAAIAREVSRQNCGVATLAAAALHAQCLPRADVKGLEMALTVAGKSPRSLVRADLEMAYGALLSAAPETRERGIAVLNTAWNAYHQLGALGEERRIDRALRAAGARRRRVPGTAKRPAEGWLALTEIERRVARLIADGYTNRGVAAELSLSSNTIGTHVRSIFGKLGVKSRVQMTRLVLEHAAVTHSGEETPSREAAKSR
jgi:DNA-binding CsgD family transcriptional regulator/tetratricopeptide (TPR) repeat protein